MIPATEIYTESLARINYIICGAQCKNKMWGLLFKYYQEFWSGESGELNQVWGAAVYVVFESARIVHPWSQPSLRCQTTAMMVSAEESCLLHSCARFPAWEIFNSWINTRVWSPGPLLPNLGQICKVTSTSKLPGASAECFIETDSHLTFSLYLIWLLLVQSKFLSTKIILLHDRDYLDP